MRRTAGAAARCGRWAGIEGKNGSKERECVKLGGSVWPGVGARVASLLVGLELGGGVVRLAALERHRGAWRLACFAERVLGSDAGENELPDAIVPAIDAVFAEARVARDAVALSIPAHRSLFREISVGFTDAETVRQVVKYEAEQHLPTTSIEDVVVNHHVLGVDAGRTHLLVSAVEKRLIARALELAARCGIDPLSIDIDLTASLNHYKACGTLDRPGRLLIAQLGYDATHIALVEAGRLRFVRSLTLGLEAGLAVDPGEPDTDPLAGLEGAAEMSLDLGSLEGDLVLSAPSLESGAHGKLGPPPRPDTAEVERSARQRYRDRLLQQLRMTLVKAKVGAVDAVALGGPGADLDEVRAALALRFGGAVLVPSPALALGPRVARDAGMDARLPAALGLAWKLAGHDLVGFELRQDELRYARLYDQVRTGLLVAASLALTLVVLVCYQVRRHYRAERERFQQAYAVASRLFALASGTTPAEALGDVEGLPVESQLPRLAAELTDRRDALAGADSDRASIDGLAAWHHVSRAFADWGRERGDGLVLERLAMDEAEVALEGWVSDRAGEQALWRKLLDLARREGASFGPPRNDSRPEGADGRVRFEYRIPLVQAGGR